MKKFKYMYYNLKIEKFEKIANYLVYLVFLLFIYFFVSKTFQNDTFYTIKIGQLIRKNGIDFLDHFCFVKGLSYVYPHFLYDILISYLYDKFNYLGVYLSTIVFTFIFAICIYNINKSKSNKYISFIITLVELFLMICFFTARAQIVTYSLFALEYYFIERYLKDPKKIYFISLIIIPILIANTHVAVFPFYFIIYFPYIVEYIISLILIKRNKKLSYFKLDVVKNNNVKKLIKVFIISLFTGFLTPLKYAPYTYLINTFRGNSLNMISEHFPLVIFNYKGYFIFIIFIILILIFTKIKIKLKDLFFLGGITLLSFMQSRQMSLAIIFDGFILCNLLFQIYEKKNNNEYKIYKFKKCVYLPILYMSVIVSIIFIPYQINYLKDQEYVDSKEYPIELVNFIKKNISDYKDKKFFNEYNYGSYLLLNNIPVFVDSRADLYTKEFNKFDGNDILTDLDNIFYEFDEIIEKYNFDYFIIYKNKDLDILIEKGYSYTKLYENDEFVLWER